MEYGNFNVGSCSLKDTKAKKLETAFGTFLHCISKDYMLKNFPDIFREYMVLSLEKVWKVSSSPVKVLDSLAYVNAISQCQWKKGKIFLRLNRYCNGAFDPEVHKTDDKIKLKKAENLCQT